MVFLSDTVRLLTKMDIIKYMMVCLASIIGEQLLVDEHTTSCSHDIMQCNKLYDQLVSNNMLENITIDGHTCDKARIYKKLFINTNCDVIYDVYNTGGRQCISNYAICINIDQLP